MEEPREAHPDIGVANYSVKYLEKLLAQATIVPAANQIENHPLLPQQEVVDFCKEKGIHITAYSPLGSTGTPLFKDESVLEVAKKHNVGAATILLSYHCKLSTSNYYFTFLTAMQWPVTPPSWPNPSRPLASTRTESSFLSTTQTWRNCHRFRRKMVASAASCTRLLVSMSDSLISLRVSI
jgi:hypothetical protein